MSKREICLCKFAEFLYVYVHVSPTVCVHIHRWLFGNITINGQHFVWPSNQIVQNDVHAHNVSIESMNEAGREVMSSEGGRQATATQRKLDRLNESWETIVAKTHDKKMALEDALREVQFPFVSLSYLHVLSSILALSRVHAVDWV